MAVQEFAAIFDSADRAQVARLHLEENLGVAAKRIRTSAGRMLHVGVTESDLREVAESLLSDEAIDLTYIERERDSCWQGRHSGRVPAASVAPGEGDAEAGPGRSR